MIVFSLAALYVVCCTLAWSGRRMAYAGLRVCAILTSGLAFTGLMVFAWAIIILALY